jgi:hypothetical protein
MAEFLANIVGIIADFFVGLSSGWMQRGLDKRKGKRQ